MELVAHGAADGVDRRIADCEDGNAVCILDSG
jgi:hypothetical protein